MTDGPKLVNLPEQQNQIAASGELLKRNMDVLIQNQITIAKIRRAAYLAYITEGFSEKEALELCCK